MHRERWIAAALALLLTGCAQTGTGGSSAQGEPSGSSGTVTPEDPQEQSGQGTPEETVYLFWPYFSSQTVDSENHTLTLENPAENTVSLRILIQDLDTGATVYQSGLLAPGAQEEWDIYTSYQSGSHTVEIRCSAPEDETIDNTFRQTITLTLS